MIIREIIKSLLRRFPKVLMFIRTVRDAMDNNQPIVKSPWGFVLQGNAQMARGDFEPDETKLIRQLILEVDLFVNVGANIGYYCCHAHSLGKPVIAVEPLARNVLYLMKNMVNNGWEKNTEIFPVAAGEISGILSLWGADTGASLVPGWAGVPEHYERKVPVLTLDRILCHSLHNKRVLIVVDIEGAELAMLKGAVNTLRNEVRPVWIVEITTYQNQPVGVISNPNFRSTFEIFFDFGYRAFVAEGLDMRELSNADVNAISAGQIKIDSYNFIFK
jgi:FkbM family methyltransferase